MIYIVTGKRNVGKTTYLKKQIQENKIKDVGGVLSLKKFDGNKFLGYEIYNIESKESCDFILNLKDELKLDEKDIKLDKFKVLNSGIEFGIKAIKEAIKTKEVIVIDEIAQLELSKRGFYKPLLEAINLEKELYVTIREELLDKAIMFFEIKKYERIQVK